jgi:hypothetical protein
LLHRRRRFGGRSNSSFAKNHDGWCWSCVGIERSLRTT